MPINKKIDVRDDRLIIEKQNITNKSWDLFKNNFNSLIERKLIAYNRF